MQICLQRSVSRIAKTASKLKGVDPPAILIPVLSARVSPPALYPCAQQARAAQNESLVDPSKPIEGSLLEKPEEPGPEDCCQSGCSLCVWDMYRDNLHEYRVQQAKLKGESPPIKALDPFEEMEMKLNGLAEEGKGPKAAEAEPSTG